MKIESSFVNRSGQTLTTVYDETDPHEGLGGKYLQSIHAYCFYGDKLVLVYNAEKARWTPVGGGIEEGETYQEAVAREVLEESNMKVLHQELIGYLDIAEPDQIVRQTRSMCIVEPIGKFEGDPDGDITEIKLIDPALYKKYFDWGQVGDHVMERAIELKKDHENKAGVDVYAEMGIGNGTFFSTEFEEDDWEHRVPRFVKPKKVRGCYLRIWVGKKVFILSTNNGFKTVKKGRNEFKLLFGVDGVN